MPHKEWEEEESQLFRSRRWPGVRRQKANKRLLIMVKDLGFPLEHNSYIEYHHQIWSVDESTQKQEHSSIISEHRQVC